MACNWREEKEILKKFSNFEKFWERFSTSEKRSIFFLEFYQDFLPTLLGQFIKEFLTQTEGIFFMTGAPDEAFQSPAKKTTEDMLNVTYISK